MRVFATRVMDKIWENRKQTVRIIPYDETTFNGGKKKKTISQKYINILFLFKIRNIWINSELIFEIFIKWLLCDTFIELKVSR